jgi:hypothetical protein
MQLIQLERSDGNFFCPATGRPVYGEDGEPNTPAFRGSWCDDLPEDPLHLTEDLSLLWEAYLEAQEAISAPVDLVAFLRSVDQPNWVTFEISISGMACGPVWSTTWTVLDLTGQSSEAEH